MPIRQIRALLEPPVELENILWNNNIIKWAGKHKNTENNCAGAFGSNSVPI